PAPPSGDPASAAEDRAPARRRRRAAAGGGADGEDRRADRSRSRGKAAAGGPAEAATLAQAAGEGQEALRRLSLRPKLSPDRAPRGRRGTAGRPLPLFAPSAAP